MLRLLSILADAVDIVFRLFAPVFFFMALWNILGDISYKNTYVSNISLQNSSKASLVAGTLLDFNSRTRKEIVKYQGLRPIRIYDMPNWMVNFTPNDNEHLLGLAIDTPFSCWIFLNKELSYITLSQITLHEYIHCFGIKHVDSPTDLMYPTYESIIDQKNIEFWAKELERIIYGR